MNPNAHGRVGRSLLVKDFSLPVYFQYVAEFGVSFSHRWAIPWVDPLELFVSTFLFSYKKEVLHLPLIWGLVDLLVLDIQDRTETKSTWLSSKETLCNATVKSDSITTCILTWILPSPPKWVEVEKVWEGEVPFVVIGLYSGAISGVSIHS